MTEDRASDAAGRGPEDSEADAARGTNGKDPPPPLSDDVNNFANGARENMPLLDKVEGIRDAGESPADRLRAERAGTGSSIFDESIDPLRRLIVVLYMLVTPPFVAVTYLLTGPGPRKAWPASAVTLLCLSGMLSARRKRIHRFTLVWPVSIVPVVCCGISFAATGMAGFAAVIGAPTAWASVMLGVPVIAGSVVTAVLTMFAAVFYQTGDWIPSMLSSVVVFVVLSLVGWVGWGKSERHRANQMELRASREKFTLAFEGSHDAIYISDMESGRFLQVNAGFERLSGIPREEAFNHSSADLGLWADPAERAAYFEALREKGFVKHWRARHIRRDGSIFWGESSSTPLMLAGKRVLLTTTRDVTAQQGYEEMLVRARHLAEESAKLKSEFLANMSHVSNFLTRCSLSTTIDNASVFLRKSGHR